MVDPRPPRTPGGYPGMSGSSQPPLPSGDPTLPSDLITPHMMDQVRQLLSTSQMQQMLQGKTQDQFEQVVQAMLAEMVGKSLEAISRKPGGSTYVNMLANIANVALTLVALWPHSRDPGLLAWAAVVTLYEKVQPNLLLRSTVSVNGHRIAPTQVVTCPGGLEWQGHVDPEDWPESDTDGMTVTIEVPQTYCPSELGMSADPRHLALGIGWMQVDPA